MQFTPVPGMGKQQSGRHPRRVPSANIGPFKPADRYCRALLPVSGDR
ncbi:hypothetical protein [Vreelandella arcis]|nr:hypothetical protein [Halomonas arcis]